MKLVVLESPYAGRGDNDREKAHALSANVSYARRCVRDCLLRDEAPIASHLLFTQEGVLRDEVPEERALGIKAGLVWLPRADYSVYYTDRGWSSGMLAALHNYSLKGGYDFRIRALTGRPVLPTTIDEAIEELLQRHIEV